MRRHAAGAERADCRRLPGIRAGVQGSTYFYGQKVGRLLDAAVDVLQLIASKRQRAALKAQARGSQQAADAALEQEALLDDEARFLCLDDVLDEAHDIDLPDAEAWGGAPAARPTHAQLLRRPDLLLLMEDLLQREAPECGATAGDPAGLAAGPGGAGEALHLQRMRVHERSGALVLDGAEAAGLDAALRPVQPDGEPEPDAGPAGDDLPPMDAADADLDLGADLPPMDTDDDFAAGGGPAGPGPAGEASPATPAAADLAGEGEEDVFDPYEPLDPYAAGELRARPFRRGLQRRNKVGRGRPPLSLWSRNGGPPGD